MIIVPSVFLDWPLISSVPYAQAGFAVVIGQGFLYFALERCDCEVFTYAVLSFFFPFPPS